MGSCKPKKNMSLRRLQESACGLKRLFSGIVKTRLPPALPEAHATRLAIVRPSDLSGDARWPMLTPVHEGRMAWQNAVAYAATLCRGRQFLSTQTLRTPAADSFLLRQT